jgi:4'-phosphopantetheinyl transferase
MSSAASCLVYLARLEQLRRGHDELLDEREAARAARFRFQADRDRFVLATALLRIVAAERAGTEPASVRLDRSCEACGRQHGRPRLPGTGLEASISHSGDVVAVALSHAGAVGVDVEVVGSRDYEPLVRSVCTAAERPLVRTAADFYAYWTRKEAVLKATGQGLRIPMTSVTVTPPGSAAGLLALNGARPPCQLADISAGAGYAGAVAVLTSEPVSVQVLAADRVLAGYSPGPASR